MLFDVLTYPRCRPLLVRFGVGKAILLYLSSIFEIIPFMSPALEVTSEGALPLSVVFVTYQRV